MDRQKFVLETEVADQPLVTFALFSYNQEKYIKEAVLGAFSQVYTPLEIIISDDCSEDRTFEIISELVSNYNGLHNVSIRQNSRNIGLIGHVNSICDIARGSIIVFAAGDDISKPERTSIAVKIFQSNSQVTLLHSQVVEINEFGIGNTLKGQSHSRFKNIEDLAISSSIYIGATGAIRKDVFTLFGKINEMNTYEDLIFGFRAALIGNLFYCNLPLVLYRPNIGVSSNLKNLNLARRDLRKKLILHRLSTLRQRRSDLKVLSNNHFNSLASKLDYEISLNATILDLQTSGLIFLKNIFFRPFLLTIRALFMEFKFYLGYLR